MSLGRSFGVALFAFLFAVYPLRIVPLFASKDGPHMSSAAAPLDPVRRAAAIARIERKREKLRSAGPKRFDQPAEAEAFYVEQRLGPGQTQLPMEQLAAARRTIVEREAALQRMRGPLPGGIQGWSELGPGNIGGRTRAIVVHPTTPSTIFAAGVAGGVWKSVDGGASWTVTDDLLLNIAVCSLVIDPVDPNILYAGTGEGFNNSDAVRGLGIFKSIDGGASWTQLAGTVSGVPFGAFFRVNDIVISPNDHNRLYAGTRYGVWRSLDAGATWTVVLSNPNFIGTPPLSNGSSVGCTDLAIRSDRNPDVLFSAFGSFDTDGLFRSTDGGTTWTQLGTAGDLLVSTQGRMAIAVAPSNNDIVYVSMARNSAPTGGMINVFRSTDGGDTWTGRLNFGNPLSAFLLSNVSFGLGCFGTSNFAQGWYDQVLAVDPVDSDIVWIGGVDLFRSDDGAQNLGIASYWFFGQGDPNFAHADQHAIVFHPQYDGTTNQTMYVGNDGGLFRTDNARAATSVEDCPFDAAPDPLPTIAWVDLNNGYGVTQFYHGDAARHEDVFGGGTQDNGTNLVTSTATPDGWLNVLGGDGGYFAIDATDPLTMYGEFQNFPNLLKSTDGGFNWFDATNGITDSDGLFITPFAMDPSDPQILWTGGQRVWRTLDGAANWGLGGSTTFPLGSRISAIAVAPSNSNIVYLGFNNGVIARTTDALAADPNWTEFNSANGLPSSGFVSSLAVQRTDPNVAYCTYSTFGVAHIFRTVNGGANWTSIDSLSAAGVPEIPVHWIAIRPCTPTQLYVGTELGIFASDDNGTSWQPANAGLAHTVVETLDFPHGNRLVAFTHGRGAFVTALEDCPCTGSLDTDGNTVTDGRDLPSFIGALFGEITTPSVVQAGDLNGDGVLNDADRLCAIEDLLGL